MSHFGNEIVKEDLYNKYIELGFSEEEAEVNAEIDFENMPDNEEESEY
jgi:hypothetical protein